MALSIDVDAIREKGNAAAADSKTNGQKGAYDKEMFLQLLVAEMQYQDPLEPTSNTEYVKELASFSEIEAVQAVQEQMQTLEANSLVGKYVTILDENAEGGIISGRVDFIENTDAGRMLSINDELYSIDKLDSIVDEDYYLASIASGTLSDMIKVIPPIGQLTLADEEKVVKAAAVFDGMNSYQQSFVDKEAVEFLQNAYNRIQALKKAMEGADKENVSENTTDAAANLSEPMDA